MAKRIKQKGSKTQWHPRAPSGWLQPRLALKRSFSAVAGAEVSPMRRLSQAPGAARARRDHQRELRGLRTGDLGSHRSLLTRGKSFPQLLRKSTFYFISSQVGTFRSPLPWQLLKGMTLSLPGGIWCRFYISTLC